MRSMHRGDCGLLATTLAELPCRRGERPRSLSSVQPRQVRALELARAPSSEGAPVTERRNQTHCHTRHVRRWPTAPVLVTEAAGSRCVPAAVFDHVAVTADPPPPPFMGRRGCGRLLGVLLVSIVTTLSSSPLRCASHYLRHFDLLLVRLGDVVTQLRTHTNVQPPSLPAAEK